MKLNQPPPPIFVLIVLWKADHFSQLNRCSQFYCASPLLFIIFGWKLDNIFCLLKKITVDQLVIVINELCRLSLIDLLVPYLSDNVNIFWFFNDRARKRKEKLRSTGGSFQNFLMGVWIEVIFVDRLYAFKSALRLMEYYSLVFRCVTPIWIGRVGTD